jgi:hypothetical protein
VPWDEQMLLQTMASNCRRPTGVSARHHWHAIYTPAVLPLWGSFLQLVLGEHVPGSCIKVSQLLPRMFLHSSQVHWHSTAPLTRATDGQQGVHLAISSHSLQEQGN